MKRSEDCDGSNYGETWNGWMKRLKGCAYGFHGGTKHVGGSSKDILGDVAGVESESHVAGMML